MDTDWLQIYESTGCTNAPYYVTSHGFLLQALNDAFASDYFGDMEIGKAVPESWHETSFANLRLKGSLKVSGEKREGAWKTSTL